MQITIGIIIGAAIASLLWSAWLARSMSGKAEIMRRNNEQNEMHLELSRRSVEAVGLRNELLEQQNEILENLLPASAKEES